MLDILEEARGSLDPVIVASHRVSERDCTVSRFHFVSHQQDCWLEFTDTERQVLVRVRYTSTLSVDEFQIVLLQDLTRTIQTFYARRVEYATYPMVSEGGSTLDSRPGGYPQTRHVWWTDAQGCRSRRIRAHLY